MLTVVAQVHIWSSGPLLGLHRQVSNFSADEFLREMGQGVRDWIGWQHSSS
jgi:hypothetical protein